MSNGCVFCGNYPMRTTNIFFHLSCRSHVSYKYHSHIWIRCLGDVLFRFSFPLATPEKPSNPFRLKPSEKRENLEKYYFNWYTWEINRWKKWYYHKNKSKLFLVFCSLYSGLRYFGRPSKKIPTKIKKNMQSINFTYENMFHIFIWIGGTPICTPLHQIQSSNSKRRCLQHTYTKHTLYTLICCSISGLSRK